MAKVEILKEWREVENECLGPDRTDNGWEMWVFVRDKQVRRGKRGEYDYEFPKRLVTISASTKRGCYDELEKLVHAPSTILVSEKGETIEIA